MLIVPTLLETVPVSKTFLFNTNKICTNFPNLFCRETVHVSGSSSAQHQEFSTVHSAMVCVRPVWWQFSSTTWMEPQWSSILVLPESYHQNCVTYISAECTVKNSWWWAEELPEGVPSWSCLKAVIKPAWHIPLPNVQWKTPDDGQRNCPKNVEFLDINKFGKLVRLLVLLKRDYWRFWY